MDNFKNTKKEITRISITCAIVMMSSFSIGGMLMFFIFMCTNLGIDNSDFIYLYIGIFLFLGIFVFLITKRILSDKKSFHYWIDKNKS